MTMETAWTFRIVLIMAFAVIIFGDFLGYGNAKKSDHPHTNDLAAASVDHQQHRVSINSQADGFANIGKEIKDSIDNHSGGSSSSEQKWSKYRDNDIEGERLNNVRGSNDVRDDFDDEEDNEEAKRIIKSNLLQLTSQEVIDEEDGGFGSKMTFAKSAAAATSKSKITETLRDSCLPKMLCEMAARPNQLLNDREKDLLSLIKSTTLTLAMAITPTRWHFAAHMGQLLRYTGDSLSGPTGCSQLWPQCPFSSQKLMRLSSKMSLK